MLKGVPENRRLWLLTVALCGVGDDALPIVQQPLRKRCEQHWSLAQSSWLVDAARAFASARRLPDAHSETRLFLTIALTTQCALSH